MSPSFPSGISAMSASFRRYAFLLLAAFAFALPARATSYSIDYTDLWWNPAEDGWGVNVIQQNEILFLTFFIYGTDNAARWVVAPGLAPTNPQPAGAARFSGDIYQTTGPWFGTQFNPAAVGRTLVGNATITFSSPDTATLSYTINGTPVVKTITRQALRTTSVAGVYLGGMIATASQCATAADNGVVDILGTTTVTQTATQVSFRVDFRTVTNQPASCNFVGPYVQKGRMAAVSAGNFSCIVGSNVTNGGTFEMTALDAQFNGFHATFTGKDQYCTYNGRFGGTRDVTG
jgi:hypothetical protein